MKDWRYDNTAPSWVFYSRVVFHMSWCLLVLCGFHAAPVIVLWSMLLGVWPFSLMDQ